MKKTVLALLALALIIPGLVAAKIGVGVGSGKIQVDQPLKSGLIYTLPALTVINTGDEVSEYTVGVQYRDKQAELLPAKDWFEFEPKNFSLEPGKSQAVVVKLTLPVSGAEPGDYFAFLQGAPVATELAADGATSVGIAAASKLYFTVEPANFFLGLYYRALSLYKEYAPWSVVVVTVVLAAIFVTIVRRFFSFNIGINLKKK